MATVSFDVPTAAIPRVKAMVQSLGPVVAPASAPAGKDPSTWSNAEALAVLKGMVTKFVVDCVKQVEAEAAAQAARVSALAAVDSAGLVT